MSFKCTSLLAPILLSESLFGGISGGNMASQQNIASQQYYLADHADAILEKGNTYSYLYSDSTIDVCELVSADGDQVFLNVPETILEGLIKSGISSGDIVILNDCILQGEWEVISLSETNY